jgi:hypothetical protein
MINLSNPLDKPMGFDFYADILRQTRPKEAIKIYYRFLFEERLKREKIKEYTRKLNHVENFNLSEKNSLIERHRIYKDKLKEIQWQKRGIEDKRHFHVLEEFVKTTNHLNHASSSHPGHSVKTKRQRGVIVENDERKVAEEEKLSRTFEVLQEKQRTFLTALDDLESNSIIFSSSTRRVSSAKPVDRKLKVQLEQKPKNLKQPIAGLKIKNLASSQESSLPKLVKKIKKSTTPANKSQVPPIELPLEYGEVMFPIIVKQKTQV